MPEIERKDIIGVLLPIFLGFALTTLAGVAASYLVTRDGVKANAQELASKAKYYTLIDEHLNEYQELYTRVSMLELRSDNANGATTDIKEILRLNTAALDKVNSTLITLSTGYGKDIEVINKRLDKAGL